jgi:hypothetical protein
MLQRTETKRNVLHRGGKDPNKSVLARRPLAALMALCGTDSFIEPSRIAKIAASTDWLIRAAVARNPATPPNLLKKLSGDAHPLVSALAIRAHLPVADGHDAGQPLARIDAARRQVDETSNSGNRS